MSIQHVRYPLLLTDHEYGEFTQSLEEFLGDDRSLSNRPTHLVADQIAKGVAYRDILDAMDLALATRKTSSDKMKFVVDDLRKKLRWMQVILPTLSDESILIPFGLNREVPVPYAALKDMADTADAYWQSVLAEPLFAPVVAGCDELSVLITGYETERSIQISAAGEYSQRQNEKDAARAGHHATERAIFNWYRSFYPDAQDDYWEQTPWGKAPEEPDAELTAWPGPAAIKAEVIDVNTVRVHIGMLEDMVDGSVQRQLQPDGEWELVAGAISIDAGEVLPVDDEGVASGTWVYRFTPLNARMEDGAVSDVEVVV
jgi:hypothetical protein